MRIWRILIVIIVWAIFCGLMQIKLREKDMSKKAAFITGVLGGGGCMIQFLFHIFIFFVTIFILYSIYTWIFG